MEILQLKYFYEVAKNQHVSNTAKELHVAQPSLTQTIHRLEKELGVKLFKSSGRNIVLTDYGIYLKNRLEPIIKALDSIPNEIDEMAKVNQNTIKLNVLAASSIITKTIIAYQDINNHIKFNMMQNSEYSDADITIFTQPFYQGNDKNIYTFSEEIYLAVPSNEIYSNMKEITLDEVSDKDFISLAGSKALRQICDRFCMHSGFSPKIIFESDSPVAVKNMIGANLGVGFWPQYTWGKMSGNTVRLLPISNPVCRRDIIIKCNDDEKKSNYKEVKKYFEFLTGFFENLKNKTV